MGVKKKTKNLPDTGGGGRVGSDRLSPFPQIKDEAFDDAEKKFRLQERLIKSFIRDISLYLQHIRVGAVKILDQHLFMKTADL